MALEIENNDGTINISSEMALKIENNDGTINIVGKGDDFISFGSDGVGSVNRKDSKTRFRKGFEYDKTVTVCNFKLAFGGKPKLFEEHKKQLIEKTNPRRVLTILHLIAILKTLKTTEKPFSYVFGGFEGKKPRIGSLKWTGTRFVDLKAPSLKFVTGGCGFSDANKVMAGYKGDTLKNLQTKMEEAFVYTCIFSPSCGGKIRFTYFTDKIEEEEKMIEDLYNTHVQSLIQQELKSVIQQELKSVEEFDRLSTEDKHAWFTKDVVGYSWVQASETLDEEDSQDLGRVRFDF